MHLGQSRRKAFASAAHIGADATLVIGHHKRFLAATLDGWTTVLYWFMLMKGIRSLELRQMQWSDVNLRCGVLQVG